MKKNPEGYTDFENDENNIIDEVKEDKEEEISEPDPTSEKNNPMIENKEETNKEDDLESLYNKKEEMTNEEDDLESLYNKKDKKEEITHATYSTSFVNNLDPEKDNIQEYVQLLLRYLSKNQNLLQKIDVVNKAGKTISLNSTIKEETDYEKFMARLKLHNSIKIPLYNSGFTINLKECTISDILSTITNIQDEIGIRFDRSRFIYYFFLDHLIVQEVKNFLSSCIDSSNLKEEPEDIFDVISLHDIDVILTYLIDLIFKDGYGGFELACSNEGCGHKETINIKPKNLIYTNFDKIKKLPKQYFAKILTDNESVKEEPEVIDEIKKMMYKDLKYEYVFEDKNFGVKSFEIEMQDVSVNDFLSMASEYMEEIYDQIEDQKNLKDVNLRYNLIRHIIPHIKTLTITERKFITNDSDEKVEVEGGNSFPMENIKEKIAFFNSAANYSEDKSKVLDFLNDKIIETKLSHIILPNSNCAKCNNPIFTDKIEDKPYIPIVPFLFFFITSIEFFNMRQ